LNANARKDEPVARFKVYAIGSRLHFRVQVWASQRALIRHRVSQGYSSARCEGATCSFDEWYASGRKTPCLGEINLNGRKLWMEVLTHEALHATAAILRRIHFKFDAMNNDPVGEGLDTEEAVALILGRFAAELHYKLAKRKLI
jgi:hypothetical protein